MSIYTKQGDKGKTGLYSGRRVSKSSLIIEALGTIDEAVSWLGVVGGQVAIQKNLMTISSILAGAKLKFPKSKTTKLEKEIDKLEKKLPKLAGFIVPGGRGAKLHYARALVRRCERVVVSVQSTKYRVQNNILIYLNRLSDYLFMLARKAGK